MNCRILSFHGLYRSYCFHISSPSSHDATKRLLTNHAIPMKNSTTTFQMLRKMRKFEQIQQLRRRRRKTKRYKNKCKIVSMIFTYLQKKTISFTDVFSSFNFQQRIILLGHPGSVQLRFDGVMHRKYTDVDQNGAQYSKYQNIVYTQYNEY